MTRIIAGLAKGRRLAVPGAGTRPTSDRAREGLFNTLATQLPLDGARVLDLFAGTGAVGLEALSRGAAGVVLVESNRRAAQVLHANVESVGLPGAEVVVCPALRTPAPGQPFELIFADPPYELGAADVAALVARFAAPEFLAADGLLVLERDARSTPPAPADSRVTGFTQKRYGETVFWYGRAR